MRDDELRVVIKNDDVTGFYLNFPTVIDVDGWLVEIADFNVFSSEISEHENCVVIGGVCVGRYVSRFVDDCFGVNFKISDFRITQNYCVGTNSFRDASQKICDEIHFS